MFAVLTINLPWNHKLPAPQQIICVHLSLEGAVRKCLGVTNFSYPLSVDIDRRG